MEEKHILQDYVTSELKIELFCFFTTGSMVWILIAVKNRYLNFSSLLKFATIQKGTKRSWNKLLQPTTSINHSLSIFPYHVHNQADFDNLFINGEDFIYLGISKLSFTF